VIWFVVGGIAVVASALWLGWVISFIDAPSDEEDPGWSRQLVEWLAARLAAIVGFFLVIPSAGVLAAWWAKVGGLSWHWRVFVGVCGSSLALVAFSEIGRVAERNARDIQNRDLRQACETDEELGALSDLLERAKRRRHSRLRGPGAPRVLERHEERLWERRRKLERSAITQTPRDSSEDEKDGES
jgi:hypothetical protein